jgi:hypothetical protein
MRTSVIMHAHTYVFMWVYIYIYIYIYACIWMCFNRVCMYGSKYVCVCVLVHASLQDISSRTRTCSISVPKLLLFAHWTQKTCMCYNKYVRDSFHGQFFLSWRNESMYVNWLAATSNTLDLFFGSKSKCAQKYDFCNTCSCFSL